MSARIATCCYCGTRAALVLKDLPGGRHELGCAACGAPLHEMKSIPSDHPPGEVRGTVPPSEVRRKGEKRRKPRSLAAWLVREIVDEIGDILD